MVSNPIFSSYVPFHVVVIVENINRTKDPELWDDPERFDPERFNPESKDNNKVPKSRMFGGGTKTCPGKGTPVNLFNPLDLCKFHR